MYFVRNNEEIHLSFKNSEKLQTQALIKKHLSLSVFGDFLNFILVLSFLTSYFLEVDVN